MVWSGIINDTIIGPYYFNANVSSETYLERLVDYLLPELNRRGLNSFQICYMHDGAPAHITNDVRQCLSDNFLSWIGRGEGSFLAWPPRSPDLNMLDFYLWGELQHRVNKIENLSVEEVQQNVEEEMDDIEPRTLRKVHLNLFKRLRLCIQEDGGLFEHLM